MARAIDADAFERFLMNLPDEVLCEDCCYVVVNEMRNYPTIDPLKNGYVLSGVLDQVRWERDVAIEQLNSYGVQLGEKAELEIVKHGKWVEKHGTWYCSECDKTGYKGYIPAKPSDYCPNCGARMNGEKSSRD